MLSTILWIIVAILALSVVGYIVAFAGCVAVFTKVFKQFKDKK